MEYIIEKQVRKQILEEIEKLIDNAINEELGISDELKRSAYEAIEKIQNDIPHKRRRWFMQKRICSMFAKRYSHNVQIYSL